MKEKILVIHQGALGDSVLNFPVFISLKRERKASVALLCSNELGNTARALNIVDALFSLENARFSTLFGGEMTPFVRTFINKYDIIILMSFSDAVEHHLRQNYGGEVHRICPRPPVDEEVHVALHLMKQLRAKGLLTSSDIFFSCPSKGMPISSSHGASMPQQEHMVVMHPGAGSARKRWPVKNFVEAAMVIKGENLGDVVFLVGPAESDLAPVVKSMSNDNFRVYEVSELVPLMELLKQTRCLIGNDSGVTHLSAFMGTPTVAIFGPSNLADCTPCFETDAANCEDPKCLHGVSIRMVFDAVREMAS
jgi:ADP-heptose:LPS heptosyltransferase